MTQMYRWSILAAVAALGASASGGTVDYDRRYLGVPDFDQVRAPGGNVVGLPGNGVNFCAPTAAINWMAFIANRGYPALNPGGPTNWQVGTDDRYNAATLWINQMGSSSYMDTSATTGSLIGGVQNGTATWLSVPDGGDDFVVTSTMLGPSYVGTMNDLWALADAGALVQVHIGWYRSDPPDAGGVPRFTRAGGHTVSLVRFRAVGDDAAPAFTIGVRDPASEQTQQQSQSLFATTQFGATTIAAQFRGAGPPFPAYSATINKVRFDGYTSGGSQGFFDGVTVIRPNFALNLDRNDQQVTLTRFSAREVAPAGLSSGFFGGTTINHVTIGIGGSRIFAAETRGLGQTYLSEFVLPGGALREVAALAPNFNDPEGAWRVCVGRSGRVYLTRTFGTVIARVDTPDEVPTPIETPLPDGLSPCREIAYDDVNDRLVGLAAPGGTSMHAEVHEFDADVNLLRTYTTTGNLSGDRRYSGMDSRIAVSPVTGNIFITSTYVSGFTPGWTWFGEFERDEPSSTLNQVAAKPLSLGPWVQSISVDHRDHVFVTFANGEGHEYVRSGTGFTRISPSLMDKGGWGEAFAMGANRSNFDPAIHTGPGWEDALPDEGAGAVVGDCGGDANLDGTTNGGDLSVLLSQFGEAVPLKGFDADFNDDGVVNGADLSVLLSNFGCDQFK